ncbi:MAG: hypothetical protein ACOC20_04815 [Oceanicaulis sp.]
MVELDASISNPQGSQARPSARSVSEDRPSGREGGLRKMVDLRGHFSNPEALIETLEEMEEVLTGSASSENDGSIKQALKPDPN